MPLIPVTKLERIEMDRQYRRECKECYVYGRVAGRAITPYTCELCNETVNYHNTAVPKICPKCSRQYGVCTRCGKEFS